jgi:hypothetical protein
MDWGQVEKTRIPDDPKCSPMQSHPEAKGDTGCWTAGHLAKGTARSILPAPKAFIAGNILLDRMLWEAAPGRLPSVDIACCDGATAAAITP